MNKKPIKLPSVNFLDNFFRSVECLTFQDLFKKNKDIFGGLIYVILKPILLVLMLILIISLIRRGIPLEEGIRLFLIPASLYFFIMEFFNSAGTYYDSNQPFKNLPYVNDLSIFFSKALSALIIFFFVFIFNYIVFEFLEIRPDYFSVLALYTATLFFSFSYFLLSSVLLSKNPELKEIHSYIPRFLLFVSCVIFPLSIFPQDIQQVLLYNPIVHIMELSRESLDHNIFEYTEDRRLSLPYVINFSISLFLLSLLTYFLKILLMRSGRTVSYFFK